MYKRFIWIVLVGVFLCASAHAAPFGYTWSIRELASTDSETVELRDDKGHLLKRIPVNQLIYIYSVLQAIAAVAELNAELLIVDGNAPNAFATKGRARLSPDAIEEGEAGTADAAADKKKGSFEGRAIKGDDVIPDDDNSIEINIVGINFAMLDLLGMDMHMVAALIGHELGHLKLQHGEESKTKHRRVDMRNAASTKYSRDNERDADYIGAIWTVEAGYDPEGAVRLQETLYKSNRFRGGAFVGSHPSSTERIAILKSLARRLSR